MSYLIPTVSCLVVGFLAGLLAFRRTERWCPHCGAVARCPECPDHPTPNEARLAIAIRRHRGDER